MPAGLVSCRPSHDLETQNCVSDTSLGATCGSAGSVVPVSIAPCYQKAERKCCCHLTHRKLEHTLGGHMFPWELSLGGCNWRGCRGDRGYSFLPSGCHDYRRKPVSSLGLCSQSTSQLLLNSQLPLMKWKLFLLISDMGKKTRTNYLFSKSRLPHLQVQFTAVGCGKQR